MNQLLPLPLPAGTGEEMLLMPSHRTTEGEILRSWKRKSLASGIRTGVRISPSRYSVSVGGSPGEVCLGAGLYRALACSIWDVVISWLMTSPNWLAIHVQACRKVHPCDFMTRSMLLPRASHTKHR